MSNNEDKEEVNRKVSDQMIFNHQEDRNIIDEPVNPINPESSNKKTDEVIRLSKLIKQVKSIIEESDKNISSEILSLLNRINSTKTEIDKHPVKTDHFDYNRIKEITTSTNLEYDSLINHINTLNLDIISKINNIDYLDLIRITESKLKENQKYVKNNESSIDISRDDKNQDQDKEIEDYFIHKIYYWKNCYYYGYVKEESNINDNTDIDNNISKDYNDSRDSKVLRKFTKHGLGLFQEDNDTYFIGNFINNRYSSGVYYNKINREIYIGSFEYKSSLGIDSKDINSRFGYYTFKGIKFENYIMNSTISTDNINNSSTTGNLIILIGEINDIHSRSIENNSSISHFFNGIFLKNNNTNSEVTDFVYLKNNIKESFTNITKIDVSNSIIELNNINTNTTTNKTNTNNSSLDNKSETILLKKESYLIKIDNSSKQAYSYYLKIGNNDDYYLGKLSYESLLPYDDNAVVFYNKEKIANRNRKINFTENISKESNDINNTEYFIGSYIEGKKEGKGSYYNNQDLLLEGEFKEDQLFKGKLYNLKNKDNSSEDKKPFFIGNFESNFPTEGELLYSNGDKFIGKISNLFERIEGDYYFKEESKLLSVKYVDGKKEGTAEFIQNIKHDNNDSSVKEHKCKVTFKNNHLVDLEILK